MKTIACLMLLTLSSVGCASTEVASVPTQSPAAAMVFTPRPALHGEPASFSRSGREIVAYGGYEQFQVSTAWVRQDDDQRFGYTYGWQDRFSRRAVSTTVRRLAR